jgi:hypothetical protein
MYTFATAFIVALASLDAAAVPCAAGEVEVTGAVIDELTQRRVGGARVRLLAGDRRQHPLSVVADRDGVFRICVGPAVFPALLFAQDGERITDGVRLGSARAAAQPVRLNLLQGAAVHLAGRVFDKQSGRALGGVEVTLADHFVAVTDRGGRFEFAGLPAGDYLLRAQHLGFQGAADTVRLVPGVNLDVTIPLALAAVELAPIVVTARVKGLEQVGFYERRQSGQGSFLTREEINRMRGIALPSDLLRGFNGLNLARRPNNRGYRVVGRNQCPFRYYVDGVRIGPHFDFDDLEWHWIDAVEVYNGLGQIPARFQDAEPMNVRSCGVVVVWTRQVAR